MHTKPIMLSIELVYCTPTEEKLLSNSKSFKSIEIENDESTGETGIKSKLKLNILKPSSRACMFGGM